MKRCFKCRSRGELGDCRNPDETRTIGSTTNPFLIDREDPKGISLANTLPGVEAIPCSSGWCGKVIEGKGTFTADGNQSLTPQLSFFNSLCARIRTRHRTDVSPTSASRSEGALCTDSAWKQRSLHVLLPGRSVQRPAFSESPSLSTPRCLFLTLATVVNNPFTRPGKLLKSVTKSLKTEKNTPYFICFYVTNFLFDSY